MIKFVQFGGRWRVAVTNCRTSVMVYQPSQYCHQTPERSILTKTPQQTKWGALEQNSVSLDICILGHHAPIPKDPQKLHSWASSVFLDASSHLFMTACPSVGLSVCWLVHPSFGWWCFFPNGWNKEIYCYLMNQAMLSVIKMEFRFLTSLYEALPVGQSVHRLGNL